jgi:hydroxymethylpyrimidine/phosphomethylpyrimidine kinase
MTPPVALTISGTDPTGCRGIEADLKAFAAHQLHGTCVVTAAGGPTEAYPLPQTAVGGQLSVALNHVAPIAVKVGMLGTAEIAASVAARARAGELPNLVLDPILDSMVGYRRGVVAAVMRLIPYASVITPSVEEASELVGWPIATTADMAGAAAQLAANGVRYVVITGGKLGGDESIDAVWTPGGVRFLHGPRVETTNHLGTGCAFSAAITAQLAIGKAPEDAVPAAKEYVNRALHGSKNWSLGHHGGPLDYFGFTAPPMRPLAAQPAA